MPDDLSYECSINKLLKLLWCCVAFLVGMHVVLTVVHYTMVELPWYVRQIFDVDEEDSFPTWYSDSALLLTSGVIWLQARRKIRFSDALRWHWLVLAVGFMLLSVDEIAGIHESLNSVMDTSWTVPGAVVGAVVGGAYITFLLQLDRRTAIWFVIGGAVFLGGALGVERYTDSFKDNDQLNTMAYYLWNAVEEGMEMSGVLIFLQALLRLMKREANGRAFELHLRD
ncbi:MAG: hypothetical protein IT582_04745 [Opitutaceae bacterium]|nr:hypothetical protein [Opitutaceae bacterium]